MFSTNPLFPLQPPLHNIAGHASCIRKDFDGGGGIARARRHWHSQRKKEKQRAENTLLSGNRLLLIYARAFLNLITYAREKEKDYKISMAKHTGINRHLEI